MAIETVTDSGVIPRHDSYDRTIVYKGFNQEDPDQLARVRVVIHRKLELSQASVCVKRSRKWMIEHELSPETFWWDFPGYLRWAQKRTDTKTRQLAEQLMEELAKIS